MLKNLRPSLAALIAVCAVLPFGGDARVGASATTPVVISQVYGGGGNSGATYKNDFVELFNAGTEPVDLTGWTVQYASSNGVSWQKTTLAGTIQPGHYYLVQEAAGSGGTVNLPTPDAVGTIAMSSSAGKVALVRNSTTLTISCPQGLVDFVGFGTATNCYEASPTANLSNTTAAIRKGGGVTDTDNNSADFTVGAPTPRNSACTLAGGCVTPTNPAISAPTVNVLQGDPFVLIVSVTPGTNPTSTSVVVTGDLTAIGGSSAQPFFDDGTNGDATAGDNIFSFSSAAVAQGGTYSLRITAIDAQGRSATPVTLQLVVAPLLAIHDIQGAGTVSPFRNQKVGTQGVVTGVKYNGFFIQAPDAGADADPATSEGIFVFTNTNPGPPATAVVGNYVQVEGTVSEYKNTSTDPDGLSMTELTSPTTTLLATGYGLPATVVLTAGDLNPGASIDALEKYEGMRVHVDSVISVTPTGGTVDEPSATSVSNGVFFGVLPGTDRPFREAGIERPLPVPPDASPGANPPTFDANPERIGVDTFSVFLDPATAKIYPPPPGATLEVTTGVTVEEVTGPLDYAYRSYIIDAEGWNMPTAKTPDAVIQGVRARTNDEFSVASMNLERFYDTVDDPNDDTVVTEAAVALRLGKASMAIREVLRAPDIIGVEEAEKLSVLEALADQVRADSLGALDYEAFLEEGNDIGGIDVGFLVRKDKIAVESVEQFGKDTIFSVDGSKLNDRPTLILSGWVLNPPYEPYPVTVLVNHLRSMSNVDAPNATGARVRAKRLAQAVELADELQRRQNAGQALISVGDYNAFDVNDGYVDVIGLLKGTEAPADQVSLWSASPVDPPLFDLFDLAPANQRYSYVFDGNAQAIDHILVSSSVHPNAIGYARMNADFPETLRGVPETPARLSDHDPIVGFFSLPDIDTHAPALTLPDSMTVEGNALGGAIVTYTATAYDQVDGSLTPTCAPASGSLFQLGKTTVRCSVADAHGNVASGSFDVTVTDKTAPTISAATPNRATLWAPNHTMVPITIRVAAADVVDPAPACWVTGVAGNDRATAADWLITGDLSLSLRATRRGAGDGRTYTITVVCRDNSDNLSQPATASVFVPHDQRK